MSVRKRHLDAPFLLNFQNGPKYRLALLENIGFLMPNRNLRGSNLYYVDLTRRYCPSVRCVFASNVYDWDIVHEVHGLVRLVIC